jgi:hypothetical protein
MPHSQIDLAGYVDDSVFGRQCRQDVRPRIDIEQGIAGLKKQGCRAVVFIGFIGIIGFAGNIVVVVVGQTQFAENV